MTKCHDKCVSKEQAAIESAIEYIDILENFLYPESQFDIPNHREVVRAKAKYLADLSILNTLSDKIKGGA